MLRTLTRVVRALDDASVAFALTGGCAVYARGGPPSDHDIDVLVPSTEAESAVQALHRMFGMRPVDPEESWLTKVYDGDWLVDVIFRPNERPVDGATLARADRVRVGPTSVPVMPATYLLTDKLLVLGPHRCDLAEPLQWARALREQVDWAEVDRATGGSPYAAAFLALCERLAVAPVERRVTVSVTDRSEYVAERLARVLAQDPRTAELGVEVEARGGEVHLRGVVTSERQHAEVAGVAAEHSADHRVRDDIRVVGTANAPGQEDVS